MAFTKEILRFTFDLAGDRWHHSPEVWQAGSQPGPDLDAALKALLRDPRAPGGRIGLKTARIRILITTGAVRERGPLFFAYAAGREVNARLTVIPAATRRLSVSAHYAVASPPTQPRAGQRRLAATTSGTRIAQCMPTAHSR
jgi:hypothetical protein